VNSQIHIHTGPGKDYTQIKQRGWRKENLPKKGEKIYQQKSKNGTNTAGTTTPVHRGHYIF
jgi:hypothetical protein